MANITDAEKEFIGEFLEKFAPATLKVLTKTLDEEVFKKIECVYGETAQVGHASSLKENNVIYELDFVRGEETGSIAILIPEELIARITDVIMGGSGEDAYKGSLSELEVNAFAEILPKIFKESENLYIKFYEQNLAFDADPLFLTKSQKDEYDKVFAQAKYDVCQNCILKINSQDAYPIKILLTSHDVHQLYSQLKIYQGNHTLKTAGVDAICMDHLSDIKIDITAELGRTSVPVKYALELDEGSMVQLETVNGEDINVYANGIAVAKAQIVAVGDSFGLRITKIISAEERMKVF